MKAKHLKAGQKVVVTFVEQGEEEYFDIGHVGVVVYDRAADIDFNNQGNSRVEGGGVWCVNPKYLKKYKEASSTKVEADPSVLAPTLWAAYKDILPADVLEELKNVIINNEGDFSDAHTLDTAFVWDKTTLGYPYWKCVDNGYYQSDYPEEEQFKEGHSLECAHSNKYSREIKPGLFVDVYNVLSAFNVTDPCLQHLIKKALACGLRGHKDRAEDLNDIKISIERAIEMHNEMEDK